DAPLFCRSRLNLRNSSGWLAKPRQPFRSLGSRQEFLPRDIALAFNQRGALVVRNMENSDRQIEDSGRAGVPALAEEIDERLSNLRNANTVALREVRREFTRRLKDAAPHVVVELAELLI